MNPCPVDGSSCNCIRFCELEKELGLLPEETNPKAARAIADGKAPLRFLQPAANAPTSRVLRHGAEKYGYRNWRIDRIKLPTYLEAVQRHLDAMKEGEWLDPDSGEPHWAHIGANVHVVLDADQFGTLDREMEPESKPLSKRVHVDNDLDAKGELPDCAGRICCWDDGPGERYDAHVCEHHGCQFRANGCVKHA